MRGGCSLGIGDTEQILVERDVLGIGVCKGPGLDQCAGGSRVDTFDAGRRTHQSSDDVERHLGGVRFAERGEYIHAAAIRHRRNLTCEAALPDTGRSYHADYRAMAVNCPVQQALNGGHLPSPSDQTGLGTCRAPILLSDAK